MMRRVFALFATIAVIALVASPFVHDAYTRNHVLNKLDPVLTEQDRLAFKAWNGDATSFAKSLFARCELVNGPHAAVCESYRLALE